MSLQTQERHCGTVWVIKCLGPITAGEAEPLQSSLERGLREFKRLVVNLRGVPRVDSTGMGLLVRFAVHARHHGGDLRLAEPSPFVSNLLQMTKLATVLRVHEREEDAILACLHEQFTESGAKVPLKGRVLFIDKSPDLCVFVRTLLKEHGYDVASTSLVHDARILLQASKMDFLIFGPDSPDAARESLTSSLKQRAPNASTLHLQSDFKHQDPHQAEAMLLGMMER